MWLDGETEPCGDALHVGPCCSLVERVILETTEIYQLRKTAVVY